MNRKHACALILCALLGSATLTIYAAETTPPPAETTAPTVTTTAPETTAAPVTTAPETTPAPVTTAAPTYSYQLTLILDDGTVCQSLSQTTTATSCTFLLVSPQAKVGYTFRGWTDGPNLHNNAYLAAPGVHILRAVWEATPYTVTYVDGTTVLGRDTYTVEKAPSLLPRAKDGYTFLGWALNGTILLIFPSGVTGNITLAAQWQLNEYKVSFDTTGGDPLPALPYTIESGLALPSPIRAGYTFTGWTTLTGTPVQVIPVGTYGDVALAAQWRANEYTITYNSAGGTPLPPTMYTIETGALLPTPTRPGYTFVGWRDAHGRQVNAIPVGSYGDLTLTAEWVEQTVTIHYTAATVGGTVSVPAETVGMATGMPMSAAIPNAGYRFVGWYRDPACTIPVEAGWVDAMDAIHPQRSGAELLHTDAVYYARFELLLGRLTVTAQGAGADQSLIFTITGQPTAAELAPVTLTVAIPAGQTAVTVADLPVGIYTVTEQDSWSWRYAPMGAMMLLVETDGTTAVPQTVQFIPQLLVDRWLSDCIYNKKEEY